MQVPLLPIADATAARVKAAGIGRVGLFGTRFTMEEEFYRGRLESLHGLEVLTPAAAERETVHRVIYDELCRGLVLDSSREAFRAVVQGLVERGAEGVILGCTEIGLLLKAADASAPLFDTATIHAEAAAEWATGPDTSLAKPCST
jgi:aspartate racemase